QVDSSGDAAVIHCSASVSCADEDPDPSDNTAESMTPLYGPVRWKTDSDGLWSNPANWDSGFVPRPDDSAIIDRPNVEITVTIPQGDFAIAGLSSQEKMIIASSGALTVKGGSQLSGL